MKTEIDDEGVIPLDYRSRPYPGHPHSNVTDIFFEVCSREDLDDGEIFRVMADIFEIMGSRNIKDGLFDAGDTRQDAYSDAWVVLGRVIEKHEKSVGDLLTDEQRDRAMRLVTDRPELKR